MARSFVPRLRRCRCGWSDMAAGSFRVDSFAASPPERTADAALDQAMLRAYSTERSVDYGTVLEDVIKLRKRVEAGYGWSDVALQLAQDNELRAAHAFQAAQSALASRFLLHAAACCRLAQAGLEHDTALRLRVYERQAHNFGRAMQHASHGSEAEYFEVAHRQAGHGAWLFRARGLEAGGPAVVVWGGADGWCEAFHASVPFYLERGLSVCLLEFPGQGLARLRHGSMLGVDFTRAVSATLDALVARGAAEQRLGVVGHSLGGSLALAASAADARIRACCSNGGSPQLLQGLLKYPRVLERFGRMLGPSASEADVVDFFDQINLEQAAKTMRASLLCVQGGQDPLVADDEARRLVALRGTPAATLEYWPEGVHCLYNHAFERNGVIADWFTTQLASDTNAARNSARSDRR
jgi:alpha-beta hydrolase superfamily lysophospholipase